MNGENIKKYDVIILGGGISGCALLYMLSRYTDIKSIALFEKYGDLGLVNTCSICNSQTLHFGDIETNYSKEKASVVKEAAEMTLKYFNLIKGDDARIYIKSHKMALGVGDKEVEILEKRYNEFKPLFPGLRKMYREEIAKIEPEIVRGRNREEKIITLYSGDGYVIDFRELAKSFVKNALKEKQKNIQISLKTEVKSIKRQNEKYLIDTNQGGYLTKFVAVNLGAHSLLYAKALGYGKEYLILPIAGNFYSSTRKILNGKVYTLQKEKLPFASVHGDPNILDLNETRFGPTVKVIPILERRNLGTIKDFIKSFGIDFKAVKSLVKILADRDILKFVIQNVIYDLPLIGRYAFLKTARKIAPAMSLKDIRYGKGLGGIRPQLVDKNTGKLLLGSAEIEGENIIFNVTPSPGATAALKQAEKTSHKIIEAFRGIHKFDKKKFEKDFK